MLDNHWPAVCAIALCAAGALLGAVVGLLYVVTTAVLKQHTTRL